MFKDRRVRVIKDGHSVANTHFLGGLSIPYIAFKPCGFTRNIDRSSYEPMVKFLKGKYMAVV